MIIKDRNRAWDGITRSSHLLSTKTGKGGSQELKKIAKGLGLSGKIVDPHTCRERLVITGVKIKQARVIGVHLAPDRFVKKVVNKKRKGCVYVKDCGRGKKDNGGGIDPVCLVRQVQCEDAPEEVQGEVQRIQENLLRELRWWRQDKGTIRG